MTIVKREQLGRPLTWEELDDNFSQVEELVSQAAASVSIAQNQAQAASQFASQAQAAASEATSGTPNIRKLWERSVSDAGLELVGGSFEDGATVTTSSQAVWYKGGNQCYVWTGSLPKSIPSNSTPSTTGDTLWKNVDTYLLKNILNDPYGARYINNVVATFDAVTNLNVTQLRDNTLVYCKGRDTPNDGGGGIFRYSASSSATVDGGIVFNITGGGRAIRQIQSSLSESQLTEPVNVRWFGAKGDASTDDTTSILNAYNAAKSRTLFYSLLFPAGRYVTYTSFVFADFASGSFIMQGATFIGGSSGADNSQKAVFEVRNTVNGNISGPWAITVKPLSGPVSGNPNAYVSGFWVNGTPGGGLQPTLGIASFFSVSDLTTIRIGNGIRIGEINNDAQMSEMQFVNCKTPFTVNPVYLAGSQALAAFVGCTLASNTVDGITNSIEASIICDGGAVAVSGGSVEQHANPNTQLVLIGPCSSSLYGNPYGSVSINGACIETIAPLCNITNRFNYANPASYLAKFTLTGITGGFIGVVPSASALVNVFDTTYEGVISIPDGSSFYSAPATPARTGYNINASGNSKVRVEIGKTVFDTKTGLMGYPRGVAGGILIHPLMLATSARLSSQNVPANTVTTVVWSVNPTDNVRLGRYQYILNTSTGAITVPNAGIRFLRIEASVPLNPGTATGNIMLYKNGSLYEFGSIGGGVGVIGTTIADPTVNDVYTVVLNVSAAVTLSGQSKLNVYLET